MPVPWAATAFALVAVLAVSTGCATLRSESDPFGRASGEALIVQVRVVNSNAYDAIVWIRGSALRRRLGTVKGDSEARFTADWSAVDQMSFDVDLLGGGKCRTRELAIRAGSVVRLDIDSMELGRADGEKRMCDVRRWR